MSKMITDQKTGAFIEQKCCIEREGHKFCSGGSCLCQRADTGKYEGIMYAHKDEDGYQFVQSWDGTLKIPAVYGREYRDNFGGKRCNVYFRYMDRYFWGKWYGMEWSMIIRCKEITEKSYFGFDYSAAKRRGLFK